MRIGIVSDMHIGYERFEEDALKQAREALLKAAEMADMIIVPGDVFDKRAPPPRVIADAIKVFREAGNIIKGKSKVIKKEGGDGKLYTEVPIVAISGTHERTAVGNENALMLLGLAGILVDTSEAKTIVEKNGERVAVFGIGGVSEEKIKEKIKELNPKPEAGAFSIFMFHQSIYELLPFNSDFMHYEDLPRGFDLYVDGHIHSRVNANVHGRQFIIPGSTVLTQLKEGEQESKGFVLYDTINKSYDFIKINSRRFVVLHIKSEKLTPSEIAEKCERSIAEEIGKIGEIPIIKLVVEGEIAMGYGGSDLQLRAMAKKYSDKAIIEIDTSKLENPELEESMEEARKSKLDGVPIKERGVQLLKERLKEYGYGGKVDASSLFELLSADGNKDKVVKTVIEDLYKIYEER
ncbi:MAG: metallophosphoesterase family protein [Candidatus Micrarchaeaceae archaeon]